MKKYAYMLVVDSIAQSEEYYKKFFGWIAEQKSADFLMMDTSSPLKFGLVEKRYLFDNLNITEADIPTGSFCTWLYDTPNELEAQKQEMKGKGLRQIGKIGCFFRDGEGMIWELRVKGEMI